MDILFTLTQKLDRVNDQGNNLGQNLKQTS